jgi:hypothetical protein
VTRPIKIGLPKCECGKTKTYTSGAWQCSHCCPTEKSIEDMERVRKRKESNGVGYRTSSNCTGQNKLFHHVAKPLKAPWEPVWAAQSTPEIVAAVREARAAQRRLGKQ